MILLIRRTSLLFITMIIIVSFLIITLYPSSKVNSEISPTVVIDAGHGDPDGGAVGKNTGVLEKDLSLAIAQCVKTELEKQGVSVIMTRTGDSGIHSDSNGTLLSKKRDDLKKRVEIANQSDAALMVSIHMNHFSDPKYSGPQMFYSANIPGSDKLAGLLRESILAHVGSHCKREIKPVTNELYLLKESKIPAVIAECGFLSNPEEELLLSDTEYQNKMAKAICAGIINYLN